MAEAGYPEVDMTQWFGLFAPAGTPQPVVDRLNQEFVRALASDEAKNNILPQTADIIAGPPADLAALIARDIVRLGKVVRESGATAPQ